MCQCAIKNSSRCTANRRPVCCKLAYACFAHIAKQQIRSIASGRLGLRVAMDEMGAFFISGPRHLSELWPLYVCNAENISHLAELYIFILFIICAQHTPTLSVFYYQVL